MRKNEAMKLIERAAQALAVALHGETGAQALPPTERSQLRKAIHAVLATLRDPDEDMVQAGAEIVRNVGKDETSEAHLSDAANTWRFMMDVLLADG